MRAMREQTHLIQREVGLLLQDVTRLADRAGNLKRHMAMTEKREIEISADRISKRGTAIDRMDFDGPQFDAAQLAAATSQPDILESPVIPDEAVE
jgi:DNA recombination protein RmuC